MHFFFYNIIFCIIQQRQAINPCLVGSVGHATLKISYITSTSHIKMSYIIIKESNYQVKGFKYVK